VNYVWVGIPEGWSGSTFMSACEAQKLLVAIADKFTLPGSRAPNAVRLTLSTAEDFDVLTNGLTKIDALLSNPALALIAAAYLSGVGLPSATTPTGKRIWLHCFGFAIFTNALPFSLLSWAQLHVTSGFAGITMAVVPLFVLPLAQVVLKEAMTPRKVLGLLGALMIIPVALFTEGMPTMAPAPQLLAIVYLGIFPTAVATILLVKVINSAGPTFMSLVNYQVPLWAVLFGIVFLGETLPPTFATALLLILAGLAIAQAKAKRFRP